MPVPHEGASRLVLYATDCVHTDDQIDGAARQEGVRNELQADAQPAFLIGVTDPAAKGKTGCQSQQEVEPGMIHPDQSTADDQYDPYHGSGSADDKEASAAGEH